MHSVLWQSEATITRPWFVVRERWTGHVTFHLKPITLTFHLHIHVVKMLIIQRVCTVELKHYMLENTMDKLINQSVYCVHNGTKSNKMGIHTIHDINLLH